MSKVVCFESKEFTTNMYHDIIRKISRIAKVSHSSNDDFDLDKPYWETLVDVKKFIAKLLRNGHLSPFEHISVTFVIKDISRFTATQLLRHRHTSFLQESLRYSKKEKLDIVFSETLRKDFEVYNLVKDEIKRIEVLYNKLTNNYKIKKEDARSILPLATKTTIIMTTNLRQYINLINIRVSVHAQKEIQEVVLKIWEILADIEPVIFDLENFLKIDGIKEKEHKIEKFMSFVLKEENRNIDKEEEEEEE